MIKPLSTISTRSLLDCLLIAFENYFVKMPEELAYWEKRFIAGRVDMDLSYGYFEGDRLAAFIVHGIDDFRGHRVAFNTGTGVIPEHRGRQIIDKLYDHAIPRLKEKGIDKLALEVITKNDRAIKVYERIGFKKMKTLLCFNGEIMSSTNRKFRLIEKSAKEIFSYSKENENYSWDNCRAAILKLNPETPTKVLMQNKTPLAYCIINEKTGYIAQLEFVKEDEAILENFLSELARVASHIKINNVWSERKLIINGFKKAGLKNTIDQYEMWRSI